ncbi:hypothetical protein [Streptomyces coffeae]|uniref:Secreted protein n=1 Tax=Streptomyces coffeae TaxID=621382 RepID=A0ABS1NCW7_9ACTN|nr:hypothetical protein [Streptomyces coffeae]MBL1097785.1 hypothetical protein [Streptomyces coffeae]
MAIALLASCGGAESTSSTGAKSADSDDQSLKHTRCMREHGVDMPDDPANQGSASTLSGDKDTIEAALKACQKYAQPSGMDPNDPKLKDDQLKLARCMREHGVDMPDPGPDGGVSFKDTDKEKVDTALKACNKPAKVGKSGQSDEGAG